MAALRAKNLGFADCLVGAGAFAGAAVDALVGIDYVCAFTLGDCAHRANLSTGATADTKVRIDFSCHSKRSFVLLC